MSGKEILVDTNILIFLLNGDAQLATFLHGKEISISFITELELLGYPSASASYESRIKTVLASCNIIPLNSAIKTAYIKIRKQTKLKLADSVVAATALSKSLPIITADTSYKSVNKLQLILYEK